MLHQMNIYGKDRVQQAIERLQTFEPEEGYYLAFSGGKDSVFDMTAMKVSDIRSWGGTRKKKAGSLLQGKYYKQYPKIKRNRR